MYVPRFNAWEDAAEVRALVDAVGTAELVSLGADGYPVATLLPVLWRRDMSGDTSVDRLVMHMARANQHWRAIAPGTPALAVVAGDQAYVSPAWYASKAKHGRVVPTWNYSAVHLTGRATVHEDPDWLRDAVTSLTDRHEQLRGAPWAVSDAPTSYVEQQLRAIVGVELVVERVEAKAKLSQNKDAADRAGVVEGLRAEGGERGAAVAELMEQLPERHR